MKNGQVEKLTPEGKPERWPLWAEDKFWAPPITGALLFVSAVLSIASGQIWLYSSLGPTAYMQAQRPRLVASRFYNVLVGHYVGIGSGYLALALLAAYHTPGVQEVKHVIPLRMYAAALAVFIDFAIDFLLKATQPASGSTAILVALGAVGAHPREAINLVIAVTIIAVLGELVRSARARQRPFTMDVEGTPPQW